MKKLKLNLFEMKGTEILTREQLKRIAGGDGGSGGTCCWHLNDWSAYDCNLSESAAQQAASNNHAMWCCDSCPSD